MKDFEATSHGPLAESIAALFGGHSDNEILQGEGFYISYNPATDTGPETAIVKDKNFYILCGDYRQEYQTIAHQGFTACLDFFKAQPVEKLSTWSDKE